MNAVTPFSQISLFSGWVIIAGNVFTVSILKSEYTGEGHVPAIYTRYLYPVIRGVGLVIIRVAALAPLYLPPFRISVNPPPPSSCHVYPRLVPWAATLNCTGRVSHPVVSTGWASISGLVFTVSNNSGDG